MDARTLIRMGHAPAERVIARHRKRLGKRVRRITIDMDPRMIGPTEANS
ncbi:MAG: hypothetical protein ACREPL_11845 [Rhodanobacteraceae bacterium]